MSLEEWLVQGQRVMNRATAPSNYINFHHRIEGQIHIKMSYVLITQMHEVVFEIFVQLAELTTSWTWFVKLNFNTLHSRKIMNNMLS